ncbi:MAG: murein transglycosylase A [Inhella sp.]|uniref:murein transglycosylase A n=1 Tax=Inhella sp. TaxID=1921806 RepID=UPI0022CA3D76|nr:MltA domain-containing protein [Inhella sp.]MCZ8235418.1 MltA domain-containing protein [Inhella sp.]
MPPLQHEAHPPRCRMGVGAALGLALLAACSSPPHQPPKPPPSPTGSPAPPGADEQGPASPIHLRGPARWVPIHWTGLPGWGQDELHTLWPVLRQNCSRPPEAWRAWCRQLQAHPEPSDPLQAHGWLMQTLQPYRVEALNGRDEGLATGYFEPELRARRQPDARFRVPLWAPPRDPALAQAPRATLQASAAQHRLQAIAYLDDALDAMLLQIQGSGRVRITEPDGREQQRRLAFAGHNQQPFQSLGRWLIEQGELREGGANWPAIKAWTLQNPERQDELLAANPRVVFFREEPLTDPALGPRGAQGLPLTPGRSVAVDPRAVPYGTPLWLDTTEPLSPTPLRRLVLAQDTGTAIVGAVRADLFFGWGEPALAQAGRMKQPLRWWALWPRGAPLPS